MYEWTQCRDRAHENLECGRDDCPFIAAGRLIGMDLRGPGYHWHVVSAGLLATPYHARSKPNSTSPEGVKALRAERKARRQSRKQQGRERRTLRNIEIVLGDEKPRRRVQ